MIYSMTGFGKAVNTCGCKKITVEVKSLNSKQLDLVLRMPPAYRACELEMRNIIGAALQRGKVEMLITCDNSDDASLQRLNVPVLRAYKRQIQNVAAELGIPEPDDWYAKLLRLPDTLAVAGEDDNADSAELDVVKRTVSEALVALNEFRAQEGRRLETFFEEKIEAIRSLLVNEVPLYEQPRVARIKQRMMDALAKLGDVAYDNNRLEQEIIFHIERLDITEEKVRLQNHLNYFLDTLHTPEPGQGKKLGFISQEMGREINTTGSKANDAELQKVVVRMKDHLEQIKEQVLNVL